MVKRGMSRKHLRVIRAIRVISAHGRGCIGLFHGLIRLIRVNRVLARVRG